MNLFGVNANPIGYTTDKEAKSKLVSIINTGTNQTEVLPAEVFESYGTIRFINLFPLVVRALQTGATLVVDEFDASIHPIALRRDEIKFVERDPKDHASTLFALSDFGTAGENGVRKNDDYLKNYLANQYGGITDVDFSSVFEHLNSGENEV